MAKLDFDHEVLQANAVDRLNSAISVLNENVTLLQSIVLPDDFTDSNDFLLAVEELSTDKNTLDNVINAIEGANSDLDTLLYNFEIRASSLPESTLKRRNNTL